MTGLSVFAAIALLTQLIAYQRYQIYKDAERVRIDNEAGIVKDKFQTLLSHSQSATKTLAFIVDKYGISGNFDSVAAAILASNEFIDVIQLTNQGVITHVYPLAGNESVIGFDIFKDSLRSPEAFKARDKKTLFFAGPFELMQGGVAVVGRLPMFRKNEFKGYSAVIIKLSTLLAACGMDKNTGEFVYQLSKRNPWTNEEEFFGYSQTAFREREYVTVQIPDGEWKLYVASREQLQWLPEVIIFSLLGLLFSLTGGIFAWHLVQQPQKLERLVRLKTSEVIKQKQNTITTLERVSDAFVALDTNWNYTYMNKKAGEIFQRDPDAMIGRHIWTEFPEGVGQPFYHAYYKAAAEQRYIYLQEHYEPYGLWFENHIYPSPDGLSIYFRDITAAKKAEQKLEASEKYFRTLIEKGSDAIILLDNEGAIKFHSPSVGRITGFQPANLSGTKITDFISAKDLHYHEELFLKLLQTEGGTTPLTLRLKHSDGRYIWIEGTYSNWLNDTSIQAVVFNFHDITERKEAEDKVRAANRLYQFTSRINQVMIHVKDEQTLFDEVCNIAIEVGQFRMAWIGKIKPQTFHAIPVSHAGDEQGYLATIESIIEQFPKHEGPVEKAIKTGVYIYCNDVENDPVLKPYREEALARGYRAAIALPIKKHENVEGVLNIYSADSFCFDDNEIVLLEEVTRNISFTLENFEKENLRRKAEQQIENEKMLSDSIINSLPGVFYLYDRNGKFLRWNKNFELVSGYSAKEIQAIQPSIFFHESEQGLVKEKINEVFERGSADVTANFYTKDKRLIPYFFNGRKVYFNNIEYLIGMGIDITKRVAAENALKERTEEIQKLTGYLQNIREEERTRIAREIHDVLGQQLTALKMDSSWLQRNNEDKRVMDRLSGMMKLIDDTIKTVRRISTELRPGVLDDLGLIAALEWQTSEFEKNTGIKAVFDSNQDELHLERNLATNIFRIYQETLTNVARHSNASQVTATLRLGENGFQLAISDNGIGFDVDEVKRKKSLGLLGMRERARMYGGELKVEKNRPNGTIIMLHVPLQQNVSVSL